MAWAGLAAKSNQKIQNPCQYKIKKHHQDFCIFSLSCVYPHGCFQTPYIYYYTIKIPRGVDISISNLKLKFKTFLPKILTCLFLILLERGGEVG